MVDDTHYGVPFDNGATIACYRTDILEEAGYTIDDLTDITWSKFMEIGKDVHEKTGKYLLTSEATGGDTLMMMIQSCGANFVNDDGEAYIVGNDVAEKCVDLYVDLVKNNVVKLVNNWDEYISTITGGEAAGIVNGNWITATLMGTQKLFVHHIQNAENGATVEFDKVLLVDKDGNVTVGAPTVDGAKVVCQIVSSLVKGDKVLVFHKKRRKGHRKLNGHRQQFTELTITEVVA